MRACECRGSIFGLVRVMLFGGSPAQVFERFKCGNPSAERERAIFLGEWRRDKGELGIHCKMFGRGGEEEVVCVCACGFVRLWLLGWDCGRNTVPQTSHRQHQTPT